MSRASTKNTFDPEFTNGILKESFPIQEMHPVQKKIIALLKDQASVALRYREIGRKIGEKYPQTVKHHLEALLDKGFIKVKNNKIFLCEEENIKNVHFINMPFYGMANCGDALINANDIIEGYIKISKKILPNRSAAGLFLVRASGNSMNQAEIKGKSIEDGDFVIIDHTKREPEDNQYILSVIDGCANIKKYKHTQGTRQITLLSDSTDEYLPIILHESDNFYVMGKVVDVIKKQ